MSTLVTRGTELIRFLQNKAVNNVATWSEDKNIQRSLIGSLDISPRKMQVTGSRLAINPLLPLKAIKLKTVKS